ncbi:MAG: RDD family protein [Bacteriovoracaceae bacterium]
MEHTQNNHNQGTEIKWNPSLEVDPEELDFKLIGDGLGFHKSNTLEEEERNLRRTVRKEGQTAPNPHLREKLKDSLAGLETRLPKAKPLNKMPSSSSLSEPLPSSPEVSLKDVGIPELPVTAPSVQTKKKTTKLKVKKVTTASIEKKIAASVIDVLVNVILFASIMLGCGYLNEIPMHIMEALIIRPDFYLYIAPLFIIQMGLYFSLLDCWQTLGKSLFGIRLVEKENGYKKSSFKVALMRFVLFIMIIPSVLDLSDRLTDSVVIKWD